MIKDLRIKFENKNFEEIQKSKIFERRGQLKAEVRV
jgi:hypothetical protein